MPPSRTAPSTAAAAAAIAPSSKKTKTSTTTPSYTPLTPPSTFNSSQVPRAVKALLTHHLKEKERIETKQLVARDEHVWLVINTKGMPKRAGKKPARIPLPHSPLPPPPASSVCLISRDPQRTYKDLLAAQDITFISRVVGIEKLKGKFKPFEARRRLMQEHDVFLCDEAVVDLMPNLLGKMFYEAKKQPLPVNMTRKDLKSELARAVNSTIWRASAGTSHAVRVATAGHHAEKEVEENILAAIPSVVEAMFKHQRLPPRSAPQKKKKGGPRPGEEAADGAQGIVAEEEMSRAEMSTEAWSDIKSIGIKTSASVMLPIWTCDLNGEDAVVRTEDKAAKGGVKGKKSKAKGEGEEEDEAMMEEDGEKEKAATTKVNGNGSSKKAAKAADDAAPATTTAPKKNVAATKAKADKTTTKTVAPSSAAGQKAKGQATGGGKGAKVETAAKKANAVKKAKGGKKA